MAPHQTSERWHEISALAAEEQDAEQMQKLTREINRLLVRERAVAEAEASATPAGRRYAFPVGLQSYVN